MCNLERVITSILLAAGMVVLCFSSGITAIPDQLNYQGRLTDNTSSPVSDGPYTITFSIYNDLSELQWRETQLDILVINGIFNALLPSDPGVEPFPDGLFSELLYIAIQVGTDDEMVPLQPLTSVPFAFTSGDSEKLEGNTLSDLDVRYVDSNDVGVVTSNMIANNSISSSDLASASVGSSEIADGGISMADLQDGAVIEEILDDDGPGSGLNADYLDGYGENIFFRLDQNEAVYSRPAFNGGTSGSTSPFTVDSSMVVSNLNADLLDGFNSTSFAQSVHSHSSLNALDGSPINALYVSITGRVGIGTISPDTLLEVNGDGSDWRNGFLALKNFDNDSGIRLYDSDTEVRHHIFNDNLGGDILRIVPASHYNTGGLSITQQGNVGIGTKTPTAKLEIRGELRTTDNEGINRLWGQGRPGVTVNGSWSITTSKGYQQNISKSIVTWSDSPSACPSNTWVCRIDEYDQEIGVSSQNLIYRGCLDSETRYGAYYGWVADTSESIGEGYMKGQDRNKLDLVSIPVCRLNAVFCCRIPL